MIKKLNKIGFFSCFWVIIIYLIIRSIKNSPSMPSIAKIFDAGAKIFSSADFYSNMFYTIKIVMIGILISFVAGTVLAIICSMNKIINEMIMPIVNAMKNIPSIALFPLFIVLMGIGDTPRIFVIIWNSIYPIISSTFVGLNSPDKDIIDAAKNCGATKWQVYRYIRIPLSALDVLNGLKISIGNGFIAIVVAEMLGATKGLGYMVLWSSNAFQYPQMYIYILVIALIGLTINVVIDKIIQITERKIYYEDKKNRIYCIGTEHAYHLPCRLWKRRIKTDTDINRKSRSSKDEVCGAKGL